MGHALKATIVLMSFPVIAPAGHACLCQLVPPEQVFENADVVMSAKPFHYRTTGERFDRKRLTTFLVTEVWKGDVSGEVVIEHGDREGFCGIDFETGEEVVVFASLNRNGVLSTGLCSQLSTRDLSPERLLELKSSAELEQRSRQVIRLVPVGD